MISPHPRLQVNVAEQLARSIVAATHAPSPNLIGANESRSSVGGERLFQQPARAPGQGRTHEDSKRTPCDAAECGALDSRLDDVSISNEHMTIVCSSNAERLSAQADAQF